jgi:hypothetical protein
MNMNFLYPLFLAGIAAVGLPIVLHMIRRHTRKRVTFSSLMFIRTTVPRLKNRGRLENLPLLILRCIILSLLAFGFSRPFFMRSMEKQSHDTQLGRRIVLLIDTSASMRRTGMWSQAISEARSTLAGVNQTDRVCIMNFDRKPQTLIGFEHWDALDPAIRASTAIEHISRLSPSWAATNLGQALIATAEAIEDDQINDKQRAIGIHQIVLISDLQQGSSLDELQAYQWPKDVELIVSPVAGKGTTNAAIQLVTSDSLLAHLEGDDPSLRVRIINSPDAVKERFKLNWANLSGRQSGQQGQTDIYVPAGHSAIVSVPYRTDSSASRKLILTGDDHDFDNTLYLAPYLEQQVNILYIGTDDVNDPDGMLYYLQRAFGAARAFNLHIISRPADNLTDTDVSTAHLIVVAEKIEQRNFVSLRRYLEAGGTTLLVLKSPQDAQMLAALAAIQSIECEEANVNKYMMLGRIEFESTCGGLLAPFSDPRFGDFTKIAFWKYRHIDAANLQPASVLAWFDNNDPAWLGMHIGKGTLLVFTSGWQPSDSNLALSTKFVPLLYSILESSGALARQTQYFVGDYVPISSLVPRLSSLVNSESQAPFQIRKPDSSVWSFDVGQEPFTKTNVPGIYAVEPPIGSETVGLSLGEFAVNLPQKESQTAIMTLEKLEMYGVSFKGAKREQQIKSAGMTTDSFLKRNSSVKLEGEQKVWRWLFIALLAVSLIEMWMAGWITGKNSKLAGEQK